MPKIVQKRKTVHNKVVKKIVVDITDAVTGEIIDIDAYQKFLQDKIKFEGRTNNLNDLITVEKLDENRIEVSGRVDLSGRYIKYLTKKFLKKHQLRDWLRIVSTGRCNYVVKFYNNVNDNEDEEEEDDAAEADE